MLVLYPSFYMFICPLLGLSLAHRSHDHCKASHWATLFPYFGGAKGAKIFFFYFFFAPLNKKRRKFCQKKFHQKNKFFKKIYSIQLNYTSPYATGATIRTGQKILTLPNDFFFYIYIFFYQFQFQTSTKIIPSWDSLQI